MRYMMALALLLTSTSVAAADTIEEYLARIRAARESISAAGEWPGRAHEAARLLSGLEHVEVTTPDGETLVVRNYWVRDAARDIRENATGEHVRTTLKLAAIEKQVEKLRTSKAEPLDVKLATGEEFMDSADKPTVKGADLGLRERLRRLSEWLRSEDKEPEPAQEHMSRRRTFAIPTGLFWGIVIGLLGVALAVIAYQVIKSRNPKDTKAPKLLKLAPQPSIENALMRSPQQWKELAHEYFEKGDYTMALRALYLALLVVLHRRRLISYETSKTNWEYVRELGGGRGERPPFEALTSAFDYKWYGRVECSRDNYLKLERMADAIVEREEKHTV